MKPVAILGAGPAGLMAAHAVALTGRPIAIITKGKDGEPVKSRLGGAQFLHVPIPNINEDTPDTMVGYATMGTPDGYRRKVYGSVSTEVVPFVSMENIVDIEEQPAWNLQATYDRLWSILGGGSVNVEDVSVKWLDEALEKDWFQTIFSTVPAPTICRTHAGLSDSYPHTFVSQRIHILNEALWEPLPDNYVLYNGASEPSWYRCSKLFGYGSTEWSDNGPVPPGAQLVSASKPIKTNCNCFKDQVHRLGRNGTWTKGVLTHDAFIGVLKVLEGM